MKTIKTVTRPYEEPEIYRIVMINGEILCTSVNGSILDEVTLEEYGEI